MSHVDGSFFVFKSFDNIQDVFLNLLDMFGVNESCYFADKFHEDGNCVCTQKGKSDSEVRVVFV